MRWHYHYLYRRRHSKYARFVFPQNMKTTPVLCVAAFAVMLQAMCATAAGGERQQQQLPLFFQAGRPFNAPGAPLPKFVGIAGNQPPQAFRTAPPQVDEEQEDEEQRNDDEPHQRNVLAPTPLPFRPQPTPQVPYNITLFCRFLILILSSQ